MNLIRARTAHQVDGAARTDSERRGAVIDADLKFLYRVLRQIHPRTTPEEIGRSDAIDRIPRRGTPGDDQRVVHISLGCVPYPDSRNQLGHFISAAAVQGQVGDLGLVHERIDLAILKVDGGSLTHYFNRLSHLADL